MKNLVFLVGFMGSGKTTLAKKMAKRLGIAFMDLDQLIISKTGKAISDYFQQHGEESFRIIERNVFREINMEEPMIISEGGGNSCFNENMKRMNANGQTIYLKISSRGLWKRLTQSDINKRPVLKGLQGEELFNFIEEELNLREPFYLQASCHIDQMKDSVNEVIQKCGLDRFQQPNHFKTNSQ